MMEVKMEDGRFLESIKGQTCRKCFSFFYCEASFRDGTFEPLNTKCPVCKSPLDYVNHYPDHSSQQDSADQ